MNWKETTNKQKNDVRKVIFSLLATHSLKQKTKFKAIENIFFLTKKPFSANMIDEKKLPSLKKIQTVQKNMYNWYTIGCLITLFPFNTPLI